MFLSAAPLARLVGGEYYEEGLLGFGPPGASDPRPARWPENAQARDVALAEALWRRSDELTDEWAQAVVDENSAAGEVLTT